MKFFGLVKGKASAYSITMRIREYGGSGVVEMEPAPADTEQIDTRFTVYHMGCFARELETAIAKWFTCDPITTPFTEGTLLHYTEIPDDTENLTYE